MLRHIVGVALIIVSLTASSTLGQSTTTTTTPAPTPTTTAPPAASSPLFQLITITRVTRWRYITLEPRGEDYWDDINPWRTKPTTTTTTTPMPTGTTFPPGPEVFQCDFDKTYCGFQHETSFAVQFEWERYRYKCPCHYTGPNNDHTTTHGFYVFMYASEPRRKGDTARLISPALVTSTGCANVTFWYHAYGHHLGHFRLKVSETPYLSWSTAFEMSGPDQNENWRKANVIVPALRYKLLFEGVVGDGYQGNYAIDDLLSRPVVCPTTTPSPNATEPLAVYDITTPTPAGIQGWAIALIIVSFVAVIVAVLLAVYCVYRQKKLRQQREQEELEEEERRRQEMDEEGIIHTDRSYSARLRSGGMAANRRLAPGYGARSNYGGRLDLPTSGVMSKRGHSPNSALGTHTSGSTNYGYDQDGDANLDQTAENTVWTREHSARIRSAAARGRGEPAQQLPAILGGETPPASASGSRQLPLSDIDLTEQRGRIGEPATIRPETPKL